MRISSATALIAALAVVALGSASCTGSSTPAVATTTTTTPTVTRTTDTFSGTVPVRGSAFNNFTIAATGLVEVTLTAAGPPSTITMGLGVGTQSGSSCAVLSGGSVNTPAGSAVQLSGTSSAGALCVKISDIGNQTSAVSYTVTVTHP